MVHTSWFNLFASLFFLRLFAFVFQHLFPGAFGAPSFLTPDLFDLFLFLALFPVLDQVNFLHQPPPGQKPVQSLGPLFTAANLNAGGFVLDVDAGVGGVDLLAALTAGTGKKFFNIALVNTQFLHAFLKVVDLFLRNRILQSSIPMISQTIMPMVTITLRNMTSSREIITPVAICMACSLF